MSREHGLSSPTVRALVRGLDAVKTAKAWTDTQLCTAMDVSQCNLNAWRAGRSGIGERNLWKVRAFLSKYVRQTA